MLLGAFPTIQMPEPVFWVAVGLAGGGTVCVVLAIVFECLFTRSGRKRSGRTMQTLPNHSATTTDSENGQAQPSAAPTPAIYSVPAAAAVPQSSIKSSIKPAENVTTDSVVEIGYDSSVDRPPI